MSSLIALKNNSSNICSLLRVYIKSKVNFTGIWLLRALGIGDGNYYIMALGPLQNNRYQWALVGEPGRQYGWILARQDLPKKTLEEIFEIAESRGYKREQFQSYPGSTKAGE